MPDVPPVKVYAAEVLNELTLEANVESQRFVTQPLEDKLIVSNIDANGTLITGVQYQDLARQSVVPMTDARFGTFVLTSVVNRYADFITLTFAKHKDDTVVDPVTGLTAKMTPYRETPTFGNHYWHPILQSLVFIEDHNFPRSTYGGRGGQSAIVTGPTYYARQIYQPSVSEGTRFIKKEYFADTPFLIPSFLVPIPTSVAYDLPGLRGSFPECLHPKIIIPSTQTATAAFVAGNQSGASSALSGQKFPETNFTEWRPYVVSAEQGMKNEGWYMATITVLPPLTPERIIR